MAECFNKLSSTFLALLLTSCQTYRLEVNSAPEDAEVLIYDPATKSYEAVGKTPLVLEEEKLSVNVMFESDMIGLVVRKRGYAPQTVLIDKSENPKFQLNLKLDPLADWAKIDSGLSASVVTDVVSSIRQIDQFIAQRDHSAALELAKKLQAKHPGSSAVWDILGTIYYISGDMISAKASYQQFLKIDPTNPRTAELLKTMEAAR